MAVRPNQVRQKGNNRWSIRIETDHALPIDTLNVWMF
jgi:hypothetical protein